MSLTFSNYKNQRDSYEFNFKFEALCEAIIENNVDFFDFWQENILPVLETTQSRNENELLDEILLEGIVRRSFRNVLGDTLGGLGRFATGVLGGAAGIGADTVQGTGEGLQKAMQQTKGGIGRGFRAARDFDPQVLGGPEQSTKQTSQTPPPLPNTAQAARDKKLADFQNRVNQQVDGVKKKFAMAMRDFVKNASDDAKNQNDPRLWQIVNKFSQKISDTANNYKINAAYGKDTYSEPFQQERDAMMKSKMGSMQQQLRNKFPDRASVRGGNSPIPTPPIVNPNFQPMTPSGPQGFMNKESIEPQNDMLVESLIRCTGSYK